MSAAKPGTADGGRQNQATGKAARRGIWTKKADSRFPDVRTIRVRHDETVKRTYTTVLKVPVMKYTTATDQEINEKRGRILDEKKMSSIRMEKRLGRICKAYCVPKPEDNAHSTIPKETPWLTSRADGTEHVIHAVIPGNVEDRDRNDNNTIPLDLRQCHYIYKDTGVASWRVASTKDGEIARLQASTNNTIFREYAWRLSYLICQGKREMRQMARDYSEKCGPLALFSHHSLVKQLEFEMPEDKDAYKHEEIPISRAVRMMFQTADLETFEKKAELKKGIPYRTSRKPNKDLSLGDTEPEEIRKEESLGVIPLKAAEDISKKKKRKRKRKKETKEKEPEPEPEPEEDKKEDEKDNISNNGREESSQPVDLAQDERDLPPETDTFPSPVLPESRTPSPVKAKKVNSKSGCCAFL